MKQLAGAQMPESRRKMSLEHDYVEKVKNCDLKNILQESLMAHRKLDVQMQGQKGDSSRVPFMKTPMDATQ